MIQFVFKTTTGRHYRLRPHVGGANPLYATTGGYIGDVNPWAISANSTPLPVELMTFDAKAEGKHVRLNWSTASEINNDYFTIERAGKDNMDEFDFITKVNSQMNNSTVTLELRSMGLQSASRSPVLPSETN
jgi:hypothetical protein